jgi:hypothetical protein
MGETYAEAGVHRLATPKTYLIKFILVALSLASLFLSLSFSVALMPVFMLLVMAVVLVFPRLNIEYEYVYCDGQLDFDRISGKMKRKRMLRIDMEQVEIVGREDAHELDSYRNNTNFTLKNFTSLQRDAKPYAIYYSSGDKKYKILFEPSEKMLSCMKSKSPRKVYI